MILKSLPSLAKHPLAQASYRWGFLFLQYSCELSWSHLITGELKTTKKKKKFKG